MTTGAMTSHIMADQNYIAGEDRVIRIDVVDDAAAPKNMTGWALEYILHGNGRYVTKTVGAGVTISNGAGTGDRATVTLDDTDTDDWKKGTYRHFLRRTDAGNEHYIMRGNVTLADEV